MGRGDYRNYYKGHMDKIKGEGGGGGGRGVPMGWGGGMLSADGEGQVPYDLTFNRKFFQLLMFLTIISKIFVLHPYQVLLS